MELGAKKALLTWFESPRWTLAGSELLLRLCLQDCSGRGAGPWPAVKRFGVVFGGMRVIISSDLYSPLLDLIAEEAAAHGHSTEMIAPGPGQERDWTEVSLAAAEEVAAGRADEAIVMCWTGTGAVLAANKIRGVRAALCSDAETARGARVWNHANVLGLSLRSTAPAIAREILKAWFETPFSTDAWNLKQMERLSAAEERFALSPAGSGAPLAR